MMKLIFHINYYLLMHKSQKFVKLFANRSLANITFSKTQLCKMIQSGGFLTDMTVITSGLYNFSFKVLKSYSKEISNIKFL